MARFVAKLMLPQEMRRRNFYARPFNSISWHKELSARDRNLSEFGQGMQICKLETVRIWIAARNRRTSRRFRYSDALRAMISYQATD
jgi:hypothetical protein